MVDMKEFVRIISKLDNGGLMLGDRFQPVHDMFEYSFGQIKKSGAHLVFVWRLHEGRYSDSNRYMKNYAIFDCIRNRQSLKELLKNENQRRTQQSTLRPYERMSYNLIRLCENYGDVIASLDESAIVSYGRKHRQDVLALITRNTDYLVFDNDFEFWSLSNLQMDAYKIVKFDRAALKQM